MNESDSVLETTKPSEPLTDQSAISKKSISWSSLAKAAAAAVGATATAFNWSPFVALAKLFHAAASMLPRRDSSGARRD